MPMTTRLPAELAAEAQAYALKLGISMNALVAVALRDYLDARRPIASSVPSSVPPPVPPEGGYRLGTSPQSVTDPKAIRPPKSRSDPCPCGAKDAMGYPVKWKHCHGR